MLKWIVVVVFFELLIISWIDVKTKKISNFWPMVNFVGAVLLYFFFKDLFVFNWEILILPLTLVLSGFFLFHWGVMGAGDSKLVASLLLILPQSLQIIFFEKLIYLTILTAAVMILMKVLRLKKNVNTSVNVIGHKRVKSKFSYAPVVALAWIFLGFSIWK